jgi:hypothetical protein
LALGAAGLILLLGLRGLGRVRSPIQSRGD